MTLQHCSLTNNRAGDGANDNTGFGFGGQGGGIYTSNGDPTVEYFTVSHNRAGDGNSAGVGGATGGAGGGI